MKKLTTKDFILRATLKHGEKYDYSKSIYNGNHKKIEVVCRKHGSFFISPANHYAGKGCATCSTFENASKFRFSQAEIIAQFKAIHGELYDYSKVKYINIDTPIIIGCKNHGLFKQTPAKHKLGRGCVKCHFEYNTFRRESYIELAKIKKKTAKLYLIRCFDELEHFFKVGITINSMQKRFDSYKLPYSYDIIHLIHGDPGLIYDLEKQVHKLLKKHQYKPRNEFKGDGECFTKIPKDVMSLLTSLKDSKQNQLII